MTISAYTGLPGHGKSYGVVENVIKKALIDKREVFTNIPMNRDVCLSRFNMSVVQFDTQDIVDNPNWWSEVFIPGSIIVIDEIWRLWPSGLNAKNVRLEDKSFLAEHRHLVGTNGLSTEIVFVTQDLAQVANFARSLVETTFRVTKQSKLGLDNRYRVDVYYGPVTGPNPPISKRDRELHGKFKKDTYQLYISHTKSIDGASGDESRTDKRFNVLGGMSVKLGLIAVTLCFFLAYSGMQKLRSSYGNNDPALKQTNTTVDVQSVVIKSEHKPVFSFLSKADTIYISYNNGVFPRIEYKFKVIQDGTESDLTARQLAALDYVLIPINQCLVRITGPDFNGVTMCKSADENRGWVSKIVTGSSSS
ncbi:MAG: hypothetical protein JKY24_04555 [Pseudomonadales bacterium]|nr:hypothetical protein [Pseudomonadales bacterium]